MEKKNKSIAKDIEGWLNVPKGRPGSIYKYIKGYLGIYKMKIRFPTTNLAGPVGIVVDGELEYPNDGREEEVYLSSIEVEALLRAGGEILDVDKGFYWRYTPKNMFHSYVNQYYDEMKKMRR